MEGYLCRLETIGQPLTKALGELGEQRSPGCRVSQKREARAQLVTGKAFQERVRCEPSIQALVDAGRRKDTSTFPHHRADHTP